MKILFLSALAIALTSCYTSKELEKEVRVKIINTVPVNINNTSNSSFSSAQSVESIQSEYMERLRSELTGSKVVLVDQNAEFEVIITSLQIDETSASETVSDTSSEQNGLTYELSTLDLEAKGTVSKTGGASNGSWFASKDKDEKLKNSRSAGQVITGGNKDRTEYREKEFDSNTVTDLAGDVGRRSAVSIVRELIKATK